MRARQAKKKALYAAHLKAVRVLRLEVEPIPQRDIDRAIVYLDATSAEFIKDMASANSTYPQTKTGVMAGRRGRG